MQQNEYDFRNKRILVVDDEEVNFLMIKDMLRDFGAEVIWARVGQEAIDLVQSGEKYHLVLMDMKMPILDGFQTTSALRKIDNSLKIIAQTAYAMDNEQEKCHAAGCDDYLSKPISMNELYEMVSKYID